MPNAFIFTSSSKQAQQHFTDTVQNGLPLQRVLRYVEDEQTKRALESVGSESVYCWGGRSGGQDEIYWTQMDDGDLIMGYRGGAIICAAQFVCKLRSSEFGREFWPDVADRPFDLIYFFSKPQFVHRPINQLQWYFGKMYQELRRLPTSPDILNDFGSFDNFVQAALRDGVAVTSAGAEIDPTYALLPMESGAGKSHLGALLTSLISKVTVESDFVKGKVYHRGTDIHARFGGQKQGEISTPRDGTFLFLFTGSAGEQHGYNDGWTEDGVFVFYGEGQHGDMEFVRGNLAIRDHVANKRSLLLFESLGGKGRYRYAGEFICGSTEFRESKDTDGNLRRAIAFHLVPLESAAIASSPPITVQDLATLRQKAFDAISSAPEARVTETVRIVRERSAAVKQYVLARADGVCESCGEPAPFRRANGEPYLEPHHTTRLADDGPDDPRFVGAICPDCHCEIHYGANGQDKNRELQEELIRIEVLDMVQRQQPQTISARSP